MSPRTNGNSGGTAAENEWEVRPGGMLVQKRNPDADQIPPPNIRVRVKYGSVYHEVSISSQASFGELKKMLSGPTGLHHEDQKLLFKDKERDSKVFLDVVGVKDRSKMVVMEDPISQEKRYLEMRKSAKMEKASKSISEISLEVDRLAGQVSALESVISKGGKVAEKTLLNLIEQLMNQLLKLDGIIADGDAKLQRKMQVKRVQKYVEILDVLKIKNSMGSNSVVSSNGNHTPVQPPSPIQRTHQEQVYSNGHSTPPVQHPQSRRSVGPFSQIPVAQPPQKQPPRHSPSGSVVITTQWEIFDSVPTPLPAPPPSSSTSNNNSTAIQPKFNWDLL